MPRRHSQLLPRLWLLTDPRLGDALWSSLKALPRGSGVIFRDYQLPQAERYIRYLAVRKIARARRLALLVAGPESLAQAWRADGSHARHAKPARRLSSAPVHSIRERIAAERAGADLLLISPVFNSTSHPGGTALGRVRFAMLARGARASVIALGGMNARRARSLKTIHGWAAIDALCHVD